MPSTALGIQVYVGCEHALSEISRSHWHISWLQHNDHSSAPPAVVIEQRAGKAEQDTESLITVGSVPSSLSSILHFLITC